VLCFLFSCKVPNEKTETLIGKVNDSKLFLEDIIEIIPVGTTGIDSVNFLKVYVDNWIQKTLLVNKAEENLTDDQKDVKSQLEAYRNDLITYIYEKEMVNQHLDTVITTDEIEQYYDSNKNNFELKDNIIKVIYVKVNKNAPKIDELKKLYKSKSSIDKEKLADYCHQFAENSYLNDDTWLLFDDLLKEIPIETYNKESFLKNKRFVEVEDSTSLYFINIKGFKIRENISPLSFEIENIKKIILNKRKIQLIAKMKEDIYKNALNKNKAVNYVN
jgi:hypothetical protein